MKILYLCHRFPFPPKRGGKIRPFNMIRHFAASGHDVTVCSLARSATEAAEGTGIAPYCADFELARVREPVQFARMVARLPVTTPSSMGYFYSPALAQRVRARLAGQRCDLIFVHCSSVAQYVEHVRDVPKILDFGDMDSQKWLEYAQYKPLPLSWGYRLEGAKLSWRKSGWRSDSTSAPRPPAPSGRRWKTTQPAPRPTGFPTASTASTSRQQTSRISSTHSFRGTHGLLPEPGMHESFLQAGLALAPCSVGRI